MFQFPDDLLIHAHDESELMDYMNSFFNARSEFCFKEHTGKQICSWEKQFSADEDSLQKVPVWVYAIETPAEYAYPIHGARTSATNLRNQLDVYSCF